MLLIIDRAEHATMQRFYRCVPTALNLPPSSPLLLAAAATRRPPPSTSNTRMRLLGNLQHQVSTPILGTTSVNHSITHPNNATSRPGARIARLLALLIIPLAQIIRTSMHNNRAPQHALRPDELDQLISSRALGIALPVRLEVAEVADVARLVGGGAVGFGVWVDFTQASAWRIRRLGRRGGEMLTVRPSRSAAIGVVTKGVDVHAALGVGVVAGDVPGDLGLGALGGLLEGDGALDVAVAADDADYALPTSLAGVQTDGF